jgi:hypothetical protein
MLKKCYWANWIRAELVIMARWIQKCLKGGKTNITVADGIPIQTDLGQGVNSKMFRCYTFHI